MPKLHIVRETKIERSAKVMQVEGIFDVSPAENSRLEWDVDIPIEGREWAIGLIVGPSGCGKTSIARDMFGENLVGEFSWPKDRSIIDGFPKEMGAKEITLLLSSVGFSSPPSWLRPYDVLSNGEKFRVTMARCLSEMPDLAVIDEFTSVVDRTVAKIGSAAIAKTVRRRKQKMIAVTCHYDVEAWLDPDWVFFPAEGRFAWRRLRGRPKIKLRIARVHHSAWAQFAGHHYLSADHNKAAVCFGAFIDDQIVAFDSWLPFFGKLAYGKARRVHRVVCLPDFQGVGIGNALTDFTASLWSGLGFRAFLGTSHPALIASQARNPKWRLARAPGRTALDTGKHERSAGFARSRANTRFTASFEFQGASMPKAQAEAALECWAAHA